jgi:hypothetical protein
MNKLDGIVHIYLKKALLSDEARPSVLSCKFPVSNGLALSSEKTGPRFMLLEMWNF